MTAAEHASVLYALGEAFSALAMRFPLWAPVSQIKAKVGDMVMVRFMRTRNPIQHVGKLVADEWVLIPEWGPVETWDPRDREAYERGERVGTQHEWEIECLDGERRRFTNVLITRLPRFEDIPNFLP